MDADLKAKWVSALRSGSYDQGREALRSGDRFCCLGVLCDVVNPEGWREVEWGAYEHNFETDGESLLSPTALRRFGLSDVQQRHLASLNDSGDTFPKIADEIERTL